MVHQLLKTMPSPTIYIEQIANLAYSMWNAHGQSEGATPAEFYLAAERHISLLLAGTMKATEKPKLLGDRVTDTFRNFSTEKYLAFIRRDAYHKWLNRGAILWDSLRDWLKAEADVLERVLRGDVRSLLSAL